MTNFEIPLPSETTLTTTEDFDSVDLQTVVENKLGSGTWEVIIGKIEADAQAKNFDFDSLMRKENVGNLVDIVLQTSFYMGGEGDLRKLSRGIETFRSGEIEEGEREFVDARSSEQLKSFSTPTTASEGLLQVQAFQSYLQDTFKNDSGMKDMVSEAYTAMLTGVGISDIQGSLTNGLGDGVGIDVSQINPDVFIGLIRERIGADTTGFGFVRPVSDEEKANDVVLFDALHTEWETGRADLPFDHPERETAPSSLIVKDVERANGSPRSRVLLEDNRIGTRTITYVNPVDALGLSDATSEIRQGLEAQMGSAQWANLDPLLQEQIIRDAVERGRKEVIDYVWASSGLAGDDFSESGLSDPDETVNTVMTRDHIDKMLGNNVAEITADIMSGGRSNITGSAFREVMDTAASLADGINQRKNANAGPNAPVTVSELNEYYFKMTDERFRELQLGAWNAGLYGTADVADIPFGDRMDEIARNHWNGAISRSRTADRLGISQTVEDILEDASFGGLEQRRRRASDLRDQGTALRSAASSSTGEDVRISTSDPLSIIAKADELAQQLLGRNASPQERQLLVKLVQGQQRDDQVAKARFDAGARANVQLSEAVAFEEEANRVEAAIEAEIAEASIRSGSVTNRQVRERTGAGMEIPDQATLDDFVNREIAIGDLNQDGTQAQQAGSTSSTGVGNVNITEFQDFDASAFMDNYLKANNAGEVQTVGVRDSFNTFLSALRSPVGG